MTSILEIAAPSIIVAEYGDTYNQLDEIYPAELRQQLAVLALETAQTVNPDVREDDIWVSGFPDGYSDERLETSDVLKSDRHVAPATTLATKEGVGGRVDDNNEYNIYEREIGELRRQKIDTNNNLLGLRDQGLLGDSQLTAGRQALRELDGQIAQLRELQKLEGRPVYFATPFSGMENSRAEDNPLSYIGEVPGVGFLALYDGRSISTDPDLRVTLKTDQQIRIAGRGVQVMKHALAVIRLNFVESK